MVVTVPPEMIGKDLTSDSFTIVEAGDDRPVTATSIPTDGLQVVLLLDASGSMGGRPITEAKSAAQSFLDAMPEGVEVAVVSFANDPAVLSEFTTDKAQTSSAISGLRLGKNTALYDGLIAGSAMFDSEQGIRRALVLLSDGGDTASETGLEEAIVSLLSAEVSFYAVELQSPESDSEALSRLGIATDGIVVAAGDPEGLTDIFVDVANQIVNRYELRYTSEAHGPTTVVVQAEADGVVAAASQAVRYPAPPPADVPSDDTTPGTTAEIVTAPPPLRPGSIVNVGWMQSSTALWLGALAVFLALVALILFTGVTQPKKRRPIQPDPDRSIDRSKGKALAALTEQATMLAERTVNRGDSTGGPVTVSLEKAGIQLRPGEVIVLSLSAALVVMAVTIALTNLLISILAGILTLLLIRAWIKRKATKRQKAFADQLPDLLHLMAGSIRTGFGLMQAMDTVATEMPAPAGEEFQRVKIEIQLGRDVDEALLAMAARVDSEDFKWVVEAIEIHREVGGDLAEILDSVMGTVRDRIRVRRRIKALAAEGRMSGWVLMVLPLLLVLMLFILSPEYISILFTTLIGRTLIVVALILMTIGAFWIKQITTLKF